MNLASGASASTHGKQTHMGNASASRPDLDGNNVVSLKPYIDTDGYLSPHSDVVALMTMEHQARMQNLITRVAYEARLAIASQEGLNKMNLSLNLPNRGIQ